MNRMQQRAFPDAYSGLMVSGGMAREGSVVNNVNNERVLAQAMDMVGNVPREKRVVRALRASVDNMRHTHGPSLIALADPLPDS